jgi:hypothetical protein
VTCGTDVRQYQVVWNYLWRARHPTKALNARVAGVGRARAPWAWRPDPGAGHRTPDPPGRAAEPRSGSVGSSEPCCGN